MRGFDENKLTERENERENLHVTELEYERCRLEEAEKMNLSENRKGRLLSTLKLMNEDSFGFERMAQLVTDIPYEAILSETEL